MHLSGPGSQFTLVDLTNLYLCHSTFIFIVFFSFAITLIMLRAPYIVNKCLHICSSFFLKCETPILLSLIDVDFTIITFVFENNTTIQHYYIYAAAINEHFLFV